MKFLLVLVVVLAGVWLWRSNRQSDQKLKQPPKAAPQPLEMVRCALCSVHVPAAEAVPGKKGIYCSADHLHRAEP
jgi:uncharacterized protein